MIYNSPSALQTSSRVQPSPPSTTGRSAVATGGSERFWSEIQVFVFVFVFVFSFVATGGSERFWSEIQVFVFVFVFLFVFVSVFVFVIVATGGSERFWSEIHQKVHLNWCELYFWEIWTLNDLKKTFQKRKLGANFWWHMEFFLIELFRTICVPTVRACI